MSGSAPGQESVNYDGPDPTVECAWPPCRNRLRRSDIGGDQWCSKAHREASVQESAATCPPHFYPTTAPCVRCGLPWHDFAAPPNIDDLLRKELTDLCVSEDLADQLMEMAKAEGKRIRVERHIRGGEAS